MSGLGIRLYTDEDVNVDLAAQLNLQGYDVVTCAGEQNASQGRDDDWQLSYATSLGRAILVHNIRHFVPLARQWADNGKEHYGIVCAPQGAIGELIRRTRIHLDTCDPLDQYNTVRYL